MERYTLDELFLEYDTFISEVSDVFETDAYGFDSHLFGMAFAQYEDVLTFIASAIYGYFYEDLVAYKGDNETLVKDIFLHRLCYDISVKLPYWYKKYNYIKKLLTTEDLSLLQTSKVTSSSNDKTNTASGTLQKTATTPSGVSTGTNVDSFNIEMGEQDEQLATSVETDGFADKYTNAQQKFANTGRIEGSRSGTITREGSIDDLLNVLEKLPSSFADEVTKAVGKHFIFDYDGEERGYYDETN